MFNLKNYRNTLLNSVHSVLGVQSAIEGCQETEVAAEQTANTRSEPPVFQGVTSTSNNDDVTPKNTIPEINDVHTRHCNLLIPNVSSKEEHSVHQKHPDNEYTPLEIALGFLSEATSTPVDTLLNNYFTTEDIEDIRCGIYDNNLEALAALIQTDSRFPFTPID